jgi:hypothetical protein
MIYFILLFFGLCDMRCQFLWIVHFVLPLQYSLSFIDISTLNVGLCNIILHAEIEYKRNNDLFYSLNVYKKRVIYHFVRLDLHMYFDVILFVMCKENHTICNVYINLTQHMSGSCFISCLLERCYKHSSQVCWRDVIHIQAKFAGEML